MAVSQRIMATVSGMVDSFKKAPPVNRKFDEGYVLLARDGQFVGAFSAELYVMAEAGKLDAQVQEKAYLARGQEVPRHIREVLFRENGERKTTFELALLADTRYSHIQKLFKKMAGIKPGNKVDLPAPVSKFRILPDYLPHLAAMGLTVYQTPKLSPLDEVKMNTRNPSANTTTVERGMHYSAQWLAWVLGLVVALQIATLAAFSITGIALAIVSGYLAQKCAKDFGTFGIVEDLLREFKWMRNPEYALKGKLDRRKAAETAIYIAGIAIVAYEAFTFSFASTLGLSAWASLASLGFAPMFVTALATFAAMSAALTAGLGAWHGLLGALRYFWPCSIFDNAIAATPGLVAAIRTLPALDDKGNRIKPRVVIDVDADADAEKEIQVSNSFVIGHDAQRQSQNETPLRDCCAGNEPAHTTTPVNEADEPNPMRAVFS